MRSSSHPRVRATVRLARIGVLLFLLMWARKIFLSSVWVAHSARAQSMLDRWPRSERISVWAVKQPRTMGREGKVATMGIQTWIRHGHACS